MILLAHNERIQIRKDRFSINVPMRKENSIKMYMLKWYTQIMSSGRYGKLYKFSVSQIYNSNIYLIQLHLDND